MLSIEHKLAKSEREIQRTVTNTDPPGAVNITGMLQNQSANVNPYLFVANARLSGSVGVTTSNITIAAVALGFSDGGTNSGNFPTFVAGSTATNNTANLIPAQSLAVKVTSATQLFINSELNVST